MKIAVIGATGMVGREVAAEALKRGHQVTAVSRAGSPVESSAAATAQAATLGDVVEMTALAQAHDVVISATGPSRTGGDHQEWLNANQRTFDAIGDTRILVVGGAGSLLLPDGSRLVDSAEFPEAYKAEALSAARLLELLRSQAERLDWTMLSPSPVIAPGERTGNYTTAKDTPAGDKISSQDFAVAMLDEVEKPAHRRARFTAAN
ncbi:NAD-dependent epimerase/dehydratase [Renibacterium salmoninarum ATCC 33209]|uniref:NAD-dependent epimerase/dehydratase n=1 Tax=Renibacterium salmoninarum (strain ATCC 33209 / DSM 20767 / JCM 11484 / NBRC 15589 / NCIMB 2235) TaxID=288705 RepID=A9WVM8_RENSM|nr:NAD(P)H-binding protein [Renibacterium salmoninarum]ABY25249.1 NAD-dependent epimerase/dehydratase [Renibacterium salmoninarum ATCC 33209]